MALDDALEYQTAGLAFARRVGIRWAEWWLLGHLTHTYYYLGDWDAAERTATEIPDPELVPDAQLNSRDAHWSLTKIALARGDLDRARQLAAGSWAPLVDSADVQTATMADAVVTDVDVATGRYHEVLERAGSALGRGDLVGLNHPAIRDCWINAVQAALALGDLEEAGRVFGVVASRPAGHVFGYLRAHVARFGAAPSGGVEQGYKSSAGLFREMGCTFEVAIVQAEHHAWLTAHGRADKRAAAELAAEARATFERLGATPWIERLDRGAVSATAG
jgi:hypothetical protein